jgi:hypothetical protein
LKQRAKEGRPKVIGTVEQNNKDRYPKYLRSPDFITDLSEAVWNFMRMTQLYS